MGLTAGDDGVKQLVTLEFKASCGRFVGRPACAAAIGAEPGTTVEIRDGNVMLMGAPSAVKSLNDYCEYVQRSIEVCFRVADCVIIPFDYPPGVPPTKIETQKQRDECQSRQKRKQHKTLSGTEEVEPPGAVPLDDAFRLDDVERLVNCQNLVKNRATKYRFFDIVVNRAVHTIVANLERAAGGGPPLKRLVVDAIDPNGIDRPFGVPRSPGTLTNDPDLGNRLFGGDGGQIQRDEGDRMLQAVANRIVTDESLRATFRHIFINTIDTDALPLALLSFTPSSAPASTTPPIQQSTLLNPPLHPPRIVICMRERGARAARELASTLGVSLENGSSFDPGWLAIDVAQLHAMILRQVPSLEHASLQEQRLAIRAIVVAWAMGGCDFVPADVVNATALTHAMVETLRANGPHTTCLRQFLAFDDEHALGAVPSLVAVARLACAQMQGRRIRNFKNDPTSLAARALWTMLYWARPSHPPPSAYDQFGFMTEVSTS